MSMSSFGGRRMQSGQWLNSITAGSTVRLCMLSCLLSPTFGSHAVGSTRWGMGMYSRWPSASSCTCDPYPGTSGGSSTAGDPGTGPAQMGTGCFLHTALLLMAQALPQPEASQYCGRLEYWNPDNKCCSSCLERFGPPPCPDHEFVENCGFNDFGDLLTHPFRKCPPGQCNPDHAEQCSPCSSGVTASLPVGSRGRTLQRCKEKPIPPKVLCPLLSEETTAPNSPVNSSLSWTTKSTSTQPSFVLISVLISVLVLLLISAVILLLPLQRRCCHQKGKAISLPSSGLVCGDPNTYTLPSLHSPSPGAPEALESRTTGKVSLLPLPGKDLPGLESQPLSRLLDELEVLEELIVLLDPEPGPAGCMAYGTTRHLAARYGLPATWSTFAYSLRPSRSPLRALIEMMVAREPSASLGQLGAHLAHLGRADALRVLSKLG